MDRQVSIGTCLFGDINRLGLGVVVILFYLLVRSK